jgi:hypothetical protein
MAESAYFDYFAAVILANVSGNDVPMATNVIPVTEVSKPIEHPKIVATSPTIVVITPIYNKATQKAGQPPPIFDGGTVAKSNFHPIQPKWKRPSPRETSSTIKLSSSIEGPSITAFLNCYDQLGAY